MAAIQPALLRAKGVAEYLSISRQTVWNWVKAGRLPEPIKVEGATVWRRADIDKFVESLAG